MRKVMAALIVVCIVAAGPAVSDADAATPKKKPRSPVSISIQLADDRLDPVSIRPGDEVSMRVVVTSSLDDPEMRIIITNGGGVRFLTGDPSWSGPSVKGMMTTIPFVVRVPMDGKGKVRALVEIGPRRAGHISSRSEHEFGASKIQRSQEAVKPKKDSRGRGVVEYR